MEQKQRLIIVDALRGLALLMIVLIHFVEHFDFFRQPEVRYLFSQGTDSKVMQWAFILISGKAYSIFAIMFGFSFYIQMSRREAQGINYSNFFLWRMFILLLMGFVHSLFYRGDILHIYAILSLPLIPLYRINNKVLVGLGILLALQIPNLYQLIQSFRIPDYEITGRMSAYWGEGNQAYAEGNLLEVIKYNIWKGRISAWSWTYNNGRYLQLLALFVVGLLLGRKRIFEDMDKNRRFFLWTFAIGIAVLVLLNTVNNSLQASELSEVQKSLFDTLFSSYKKLSATAGVLSLFTLIYIAFSNGSFFQLLAAYGKMSLSNYVFQALFGIVFFYNFGLGLYRYMGSTWSLLLGITFFFLQAYISKYWNKNFRYGPLEWLWRCLTDFDFKIKFRR